MSPYFFNQFKDIKKSEWPKTFLLSLYFFLVVATFWLLKPMKKSLLINHFAGDPLVLFGFVFSGSEVEQLAKVLNLIVTAFVVVIFTWLVQNVQRQYLVAIFSGIFISGLLFFVSINIEPTSMGWYIWGFYVFGDMFNMIMIALFWAFTSDISNSSEANRTYGIIGLGGVVGGFVGSTIVRTFVADVGRIPLLLYAIIPIIIISVIAFLVDWLQNGRKLNKQNTAAGYGKLWDGAKIVFNSNYLLAIAAFVGFYEITSNIIDFQLATLVEIEIVSDIGKDEFFGLVGQAVNIGSIIIQLFLTTHIMKRFGVGIALATLPIIVSLVSVSFLFMPVLFVAATLSVSDNSLNYSINQTARETLFAPTSAEVTYKAKSFIDMFVQRMAKVISVILNLLFSIVLVSGVRWLSIITVIIMFCWLYLIKYVSDNDDIDFK